MTNFTPDLLSLGTAAARKLATTTKSEPQTLTTSPRWLLRMLPWVQVTAGTYRVNRRLAYRVGDGRVAMAGTGSRVWVVPEQLVELPLLRGLTDLAVLRACAERFTAREVAPGEELAVAGAPAGRLVLVARGLAHELGPAEYQQPDQRGPLRRVLGPGEHVGGGVGPGSLLAPDGRWEHTVIAATPGTALTLARRDLDELATRHPPLAAHLGRLRSGTPAPRAQNRYGEAALDLSAGHHGEPDLPGTFVDYDLAPRELALSVAQVVLRVHTRVSDLYHDPHDQYEQQLRLTVEALRERQEHELLNNPEFGLLHNADLRQRLYPRTGPPTPDDLDRLLSRRRRSHFFVAHPRTIAAFGRQCTRRGIAPGTVAVAGGARMLAWRGVPLLPCDKVPVSAGGTSSVLVLRTGEEHHGVVGLGPPELPHAHPHQPGVSVRPAGTDGKGIARYLVSAYYSVAVLVPDALGVLEDVDIREQP